MHIQSLEQVPQELAFELDCFVGEWDHHMERVRQLLHLLVERRGQICSSPQNLLETIQLNEQIGAEMERLLIYTQLLLEIEDSNEDFLKLSAQAETLLANIQSQTEFVAEEIREFDGDMLLQWMAKSSELNAYKQFFRSLKQNKEEDSSLLASVQQLSGYLERTHRTLLTQDIQFEAVRDESGVLHELTLENYRTLLGSADRVYRERIFRVVYDTFHKFRKTFAANLHVQFFNTSLVASASETGSLLRKALQHEGLSEEGYQAFLEMVHDHFFLNHRYYAWSAHALQLEKMAPYDQYVTRNGAETPNVELEEAKRLIVDAFAFLGPSYQQDVNDALQRVITTTHLSNFTVNLYLERPVIVMQYQGKLPSLLVLAHEAGHAVHMMRTNARQSYVHTEILNVASEMVALLHENIVLRHLRNNLPKESWRKHVEFFTMDNYRYNLFKATMLFEFEHFLHQALQEEQILTASFLGETYGDLLKCYNGKSFEVDDRISLDWIRVIHLYTPYYLAAYPLAFALADRVAQALFHKDSTMIDCYFAFLEKGSSLDPKELFEMIGIDLEEKEEYRTAFQTFEQLLNVYFETDEKIGF